MESGSCGDICDVSDLRGGDLLDDPLLPLREIPVHPRIELLREAVRNERTLAANTFEVNGAWTITINRASGQDMGLRFKESYCLWT